MADVKVPREALPLFNPDAPQQFARLKKEINDGNDVSFFLSSIAYRDIWSFIFQLNSSMFPTANDHGNPITYELDSTNVQSSPEIEKLGHLIKELGTIIDEVPPDTGPRRFGNISFRKWFEIMKQRLPSLMDRYLPPQVLNFGSATTGEVKSKDELEAYLCGSFGSVQRLDYGTGHELSFLAFLAGIWKLGGFQIIKPGEKERAIVLGVIEPYLQLIRRLILTYTLEPAGSHGVWGLDDHSFLPYIFGSAQLSPPISSLADITDEGSLDGAPEPGDVAKANAVERQRKTNMYFSAIGFIYDVKKGPFWEHSPILFDISGVRAGWAKINKGMIKMYNAEVLSKFPVVQHFHFGCLFKWEKDPNSIEAKQTIHTASQPRREKNGKIASLRETPQGSSRVPQGPGRAPWALPSGAPPAPQATAAPWARPGGAGVTPTESHTARFPTPTQTPWSKKPDQG